MKKFSCLTYMIVFCAIIVDRNSIIHISYADLFGNNQQSTSIQPVLPPQGFAIQDTGRTTNQANPAGFFPFDTTTSSQANWAIVAWTNPTNLPYFNPFLTLPSFSPNHELTGLTWLTSSSQNASQNMAIVANQSLTTGITSEILMQDGLSNSGQCSENHSNTLEYDFFIFPNSQSNNPYYPSAYLKNSDKLTLDKITAINIDGSVELLAQMSIDNPSKCQISQSSMIYSLIFNNIVSGQILFYQLDLNFFCYPGPDRVWNSWCSTVVPQMNYFFTGQNNVWGIDDPITNFVNPQTNTPYSFLQNQATMNLKINFLPRITNLINDAKYGLDNNVSHWQWGGIYYGQHTWGNTALVSKWASKNFAPTIISAPLK